MAQADSGESARLGERQWLRCARRYSAAFVDGTMSDRLHGGSPGPLTPEATRTAVTSSDRGAARRPSAPPPSLERKPACKPYEGAARKVIEALALD